MNQYRELFRSRIESAVREARAARSIPHQGVKGEVLEILLRELFLPLVPSDIGIASGHIVSFDGEHVSPQTDVILYNKSIVPPILFRQDLAFVPVESVLYTIEIKTTLTAQGLRQAHEAAKRLQEFPHLPGFRDQNGVERHHQVDHPRTVVLALGTDITEGGQLEAERYRRIYEDEYPYIRAICVVNREYSWESDGTWNVKRGSESYDEMLAFIGGISNTYKWVSMNRGHPNLGHYLIDPQGKTEHI